MPPRLPSIPQHIKRFCQQSRPLVAPQQRRERPSNSLQDRKDGGSPTELAKTAAVGGDTLIRERAGTEEVAKFIVSSTKSTGRGGTPETTHAPTTADGMSRLAHPPSCCWMAPGGISSAGNCTSRTTSASCICRPIHRNSTRWRTSGNSSGRTFSAIASPTATTPLSTPAVQHGMLSSLCLNASSQSRGEVGLQRSTHRAAGITFNHASHIKALGMS
jgi:hypothetical protein